ncbi:hypothetical protein KC19_1G031400 [Ceratodon purpureus]|uniref:Uncharacterized protein n=1 Tax=Ceratodon purpureus TaxID=3225 RepID=A0A8T0J379_CERPU|nr:hypothetical protein KC19_1G031400 [Ceratodon purpureus]
MASLDTLPFARHFPQSATASRTSRTCEREFMRTEVYASFEHGGSWSERREA